MRFLGCFAGLVAALSFAGSAHAASRLTSSSIRAVVSSTNVEDGARQVVAEVAPWANGAVLGTPSVVTLAAGDRLVRLPQTHFGLPVLGRGAVVTFGADGIASHVSLQIEDDLPASATADILPSDAAAIATNSSGIAAEAKDATLAIWPSPDGAKLVWVVYAPPTQLPYAPVVLVDARSGELLLRYNAVTTVDKAQVYPTNPVKSPMLADVVLNPTAASTTLQNELVESQNCIDKKSLKMIMGFNVHVCDLLQTAQADANGDFLIAPADDKAPEDAFSEVSMFYHVNRAYAFFRGFNPKLDVNGGKPLPTVSNLRLPQGYQTLDIAKLMDPNLPLDPFQNAFFSPANPLFSTIFGIQGGAMWFGQGPNRDYSYDGDVIYHEFTHSVVNVTLKLVGNPHMDEFGASYSPGAMNEGLADFFSSALAGDPDVGEYAAQDFAPGSKAIRTLDNKDTCPSTIGGEVHQDSTLFSGSLWDARKGLSVSDQSQFDAAIFKAMNSSPTGDLSYEDFAKLATDALSSSPLGKTAADSLTAAFTAHGILPQCTRVLEYGDQPLDGPKDLQGIFFAPGTSTTGVKTAKGWTAGVVQAHAKLPAETGNITVEITNVDLGGGGLMMGTGTPFRPTVVARFGSDPIKFTYKPMATQADTTATEAMLSGGKYSATIKVPDGATEAYVMIGNLGQSDGAYTHVTVTSAASMTGAGGGPSASASASTTGGAGGGGGSQPKDTPAADGTNGCGCSMPGDASFGGEAALFAAAIGAILARRRRR